MPGSRADGLLRPRGLRQLERQTQCERNSPPNGRAIHHYGRPQAPSHHAAGCQAHSFQAHDWQRTSHYARYQTERSGDKEGLAPCRGVQDRPHAVRVVPAPQRCEHSRPQSVGWSTVPRWRQDQHTAVPARHPGVPAGPARRLAQGLAQRLTPPLSGRTRGAYRREPAASGADPTFAGRPHCGCGDDSASGRTDPADVAGASTSRLYGRGSKRSWACATPWGLRCRRSGRSTCPTAPSRALCQQAC
jgi:hypothetical protein